MGNYIIFGGFEDPGRGGQGRNLTTNVPKILDLKSSSSEQIFSKKIVVGCPCILRSLVQNLSSSKFDEFLSLSFLFICFPIFILGSKIGNEMIHNLQMTFYWYNNNNGIYIALIHRCSKRFTM